MGRTRSAVLFAALLATSLAVFPAGPSVAGAQMASAPLPPKLGTGLIAPDQMEKLLPPSVYFSGQSAPLQVRNTAGFRDAAGHITWAGLVDTSGYSTGVREKYQFYFVTDAPVTAGSLKIAPGVYGGGFLADNTFVLLDVSSNEIGRTKVQVDSALRRPRPLQMTMEGGSLRLYVGRQYLPFSVR